MKLSFRNHQHIYENLDRTKYLAWDHVESVEALFFYMSAFFSHITFVYIQTNKTFIKDC